MSTITIFSVVGPCLREESFANEESGVLRRAHERKFRIPQKPKSIAMKKITVHWPIINLLKSYIRPCVTACQSKCSESCLAIEANVQDPE